MTTRAPSDVNVRDFGLDEPDVARSRPRSSSFMARLTSTSTASETNNSDVAPMALTEEGLADSDDLVAFEDGPDRDIPPPTDLDAPNGTAPHRKRLELIWDADMQNRPKPKQTIEGVLLEKSTAMLVGKPGTGKGLILVDMFYRVSHAMEYYGHATTPGLCIYLALERAGGLGARIRAWKHHHNRHGSANVAFIKGRVSLFEPAGAAQVLEILDAMGQPVRLLAVDTLAKAILPGDENSTRDAGVFMENLQRIAETGPSVIGAHHLNAVGNRERGNTALLGDVDTKILATGETGQITLACDKMNELAHFQDIRLRVVAVPEADSATVEYSDRSIGAMLTPAQLRVLKGLRNAALGGEASPTDWMKASGEMAPSTFYEARSLLLSERYVKQGGTRARPKYSLSLAGESAIAPDSGNTPISLRSESDNSTLRYSGGLMKAPGSESESQDPERLEDAER